jgi:hypothetical protein
MIGRFVTIAFLSAALAACGGSTPGAGDGGAGGAGGTPTSDAAAGAAGGAGMGAAGATTPPSEAGATDTADAMPERAGDTAATDATPDTSPDLGALPDGAGGAGSVPGTGWPAVADYGARGPFTVMRQMNTGPGAAYDVFHPSPLGADTRRHPIIRWANGTLFGLADYQKLLEHWASHGFVVIAAHTNSTAGGGTHKAAVDWLVAENARAGSLFVGKLDTAHVGASGHSQGGGATIAAGAQKPGAVALTTTLPLMPILSYETDKTILGKQTAPMLNINATMDDRDPTGAIAEQIFTAAKAELVQAAYIGIHEDAMTAAMFAPTLAWFRLRLMGDEQARAKFYPPGGCGLCRDAAWKQVRFANVP